MVALTLLGLMPMQLRVCSGVSPCIGCTPLPQAKTL